MCVCDALHRSPSNRSHNPPPFPNNLTVAALNSMLSSGCSRIYPIPSTDQYILKKTGLSLSYLARTGEEVIPFLYLSNNFTRSVVHSTFGISCRWRLRCRARRGLRLISNQGEKHEYNAHNPMKAERGVPWLDNVQSVSRLNFDCAEQFLLGSEKLCTIVAKIAPRTHNLYFYLHVD